MKTLTALALVLMTAPLSAQDSAAVEIAFHAEAGTEHQVQLRCDSTMVAVEEPWPASPSASICGTGIVFPPDSTFTELVERPGPGARRFVGGRVRVVVHEPNDYQGEWVYANAIEIAAQVPPPPSDVRLREVPLPGDTVPEPLPPDTTAPPPEPQPPPEGVVPAFPGAQGYGAVASGGRGGRVYVVTSLEDNAASPAPGTLRHALLQSHPRTVVFAVAGEIRFNGQLQLRNSNSGLTIAGQTAPGSGITVSGNLNLRSVDEVIIRYVRMRKDPNPPQNNFTITGGTNVILDHVSGQFSTDDNIEAWVQIGNSGAGPIHNLTLSRSIVGPETGSHATAGGWRGYYQAGDHLELTNVDYHRNLFVHNSHRTPHTRADGAKVVNNVVYNNNYTALESVSSTTIDHINNYLKNGPFGTFSRSWVYITHEAHHLNDPDNPHPLASIYVSGNVGDVRYTDPDQDNWLMVHNAFTRQPLPREHQRLQPLPDAEIPIQIVTAAQAYQSVLADVGANRRVSCSGDWVENIDALDAQLIDDARTGTGPPSLPVTAADFGGLPPVDRGTPCTDGDGDGMPDEFELRYGVDDVNGDPDGDTYTNIEEYTNATDPTDPRA